MEKKTRKKSDLLTTLIVIIVAISIIAIVIFGMTYFFNSIKIENKTEQQSEQDIRRNNDVILFKIDNNKYINQYGYITINTNNSAILLSGITLKENQEQIESTLFEKLLKLHITLKDNELLNNISKIDISDIENIKIYMDSENKIVQLGNFENLSTKITYVKSIIEKEKGISGTIFVNDIEKVYFRENL